MRNHAVQEALVFPLFQPEPMVSRRQRTIVNVIRVILVQLVNLHLVLTHVLRAHV